MGETVRVYLWAAAEGAVVVATPVEVPKAVHEKMQRDPGGVVVMCERCGKGPATHMERTPGHPDDRPEYLPYCPNCHVGGA
jgi:hypothetical protein